MISWASKDASEVRSYRYSWLGRLNGATITSATLTVDSGTVTLSGVGNDDNAIFATISGGADCEDAILLSTVVTDAGETLEEAIVLRIRPSYFLNAGPSTSTKRDLVSMAYEECALSGYEFDVTPEEMFSGLRALDAAMAEDKAASIDLNYNAPELFGQGDLEDYSGIPDAAISYASLRLAKAMCSRMGKPLSTEARARLASAAIRVQAVCAQTPEMGWARGTPAGAGNRWYSWRGPFMPVGTR